MASFSGVYFIYDGECPMCKSAAYAIRIKKKFGELHLINARDHGDHSLIKSINTLGYDLDEGMVIYHDGAFHHGKSALKFMAKYGEAKNGFSAFCKSMFWSDTISAVTYPWMRGMRNWLLRRKSAPRIDNLKLKSQPIFKSIFGDDWDALPAVFKEHYALCPYTDDQITVKGVLDTYCAGPIKWFSPLFWMMKGIPPHTEKNVETTVHFKSDKNTKAFHFNRVFHFKTRAPYNFHSRMIQLRDNIVVEVMHYGLGWKMSYHWDGDKVTLRHKGYVLNAFGHFIPLPTTWFLGQGYAEEIAIDGNSFAMITHITHPIWGKIYEYKGQFSF